MLHAYAIPLSSREGSWQWPQLLRKPELVPGSGQPWATWRTNALQRISHRPASGVETYFHHQRLGRGKFARTAGANKLLEFASRARRQCLDSATLSSTGTGWMTLRAWHSAQDIWSASRSIRNVAELNLVEVVLDHPRKRLNATKACML